MSPPNPHGFVIGLLRKKISYQLTQNHIPNRYETLDTHLTNCKENASFYLSPLYRLHDFIVCIGRCSEMITKFVYSFLATNLLYLLLTNKGELG